MKMCFSAYFVPWHLVIFVEHSPKINFISNSCHWCDMMYHVMLCDMMQWYDAKNDANAEDTPTLKHNLCVPLWTIKISLPLIFRCKFCIPLGTPFELLCLLFWRYSCWVFALRLIFRRYLALHYLWNDFWAENLHCAPLGMTFCSFDKLTLRSLGTTFCSFGKLTLRSLGTTFCSFGETCTAIFSSAFP
jgi:hypothetical protein